MAKQYTLPQLNYQLNELEPYISAEIMDLHYNKHHNTYIQKLNKLLEQYESLEKDGQIDKMIALEPAIRFNGGGYINHSIFWTNLAPKSQGGGELPTGAFAEAVTKEFGSFDALIKKMSEKAVAVPGSGWCWLGFNKDGCRMEIVTCQNQDPISTTGLIPLLGIDVWEHAYYLQYKNVRPDYLKAIWEVINWTNVAERYTAANACCSAGSCH